MSNVLDKLTDSYHEHKHLEFIRLLITPEDLAEVLGHTDHRVRSIEVNRQMIDIKLEIKNIKKGLDIWNTYRRFDVIKLKERKLW